ncbi:low-density lipoprotein receptor-related protein [Elysia marginata]|uniref:Low-density lipoprotein receptor-related protein n=1 Tax=Elysia marginata TaxID=1093978 RepID=A0AAV4EHK3_9GAST|nr:low-density lipoprotein receptor-related protein [Elysia marginata]
MFPLISTADASSIETSKKHSSSVPGGPANTTAKAKAVKTTHLSTTKAKARQPCHRNQFRCKNGDCIPGVNACDGQTDCSDGTDETWCRLLISSSRHRPKHLLCRAVGGARFHETIHWFMQRPGQSDLVNITQRLEEKHPGLTTRVSVQERHRWLKFNSKLVFKFVSRDDAGTYFCRSFNLTSQPQRLGTSSS